MVPEQFQAASVNGVFSTGRLTFSGFYGKFVTNIYLCEGICYDAANNSLWSCVHDYVDLWQNSCQLSNHHAAKRLGVAGPQYGVSLSVSSDDQQLVSVEQTRQVLLQHLGLICCNELSADKRPYRADEKRPEIDSMFLHYTVQLLTSAVDREDAVGVQCLLMVLQVRMCTR